MNGRGYRAEALHGGMDQAQRDRVMGRLRDGTAELLVATDVAARGLDVDTLTHVVNYDVPSAPESYVHRIGRVGRAGREGVAITLAEPREQRLLANIERAHQTADQHRERADRRRPAGAPDRGRPSKPCGSRSAPRISTTTARCSTSCPASTTCATIALAAIKLAHEADGASTDDIEIPTSSKRFDRNEGSSRDKGHRGQQKRGMKADDRGKDNEPTGYLYVGIGRKGGVRPGDLVGAIANETGLEGRQIGPIRISDNFSVVGVPERKVDDVIGAMRATSIRGKATTVRRYTD